MEVIFITEEQNTKLVLLPETTVERLLLEDVLKRGQIQADLIKGPVDIMGRPALGGLLIQPGINNDTSKAEKVFALHTDEIHLEERREAEVL